MIQLGSFEVSFMRCIVISKFWTPTIMLWKSHDFTHFLDAGPRVRSARRRKELPSLLRGAFLQDFGSDLARFSKIQ